MCLNVADLITQEVTSTLEKMTPKVRVAKRKVNQGNSYYL